MQRPDMRIVIPARPSPLSQDATPSLSSSYNSTSSSSTTLMTPASHSSHSGCLHRSDDRPGTPYPGDCQLCFTGHQVEQRKAPAADLGALAEEEEPVPEMGEATAVTVTTIQPEEVTPCVVSSSSSTSSSRASTDSTSSGVDRCTTGVSESETAHSKSSSTKPRKSRGSWIKRVFVFEHTDISIEKKVVSTPSSLSTSVSTPATAPTAARPPTSTSTPTTVPPTASPPAYRPRCFAPITLVPTVDYAYTAENSCWKAPPVISEMAKRDKQVKSHLPLQRRLSEDRENLV